MRGEIFLGEALTALRLLAPETEGDAAAVLNLLGVRMSGAKSAPAAAPATLPKPTPPPPPPIEAPPPGALPDLTSHPTALPAKITYHRGGPTPDFRWPGGVSALAMAPRAQPAPFEPLLQPSWVRGVLFAATATLVDGREIDTASWVATVARGMVPSTVPRRPRWSTRVGAQLLVDVGESMSPFRADRSWLIKELSNVVGRDHLDVQRFAECPLRAVGTGPRSTWRAYRPPPVGTPVLAFTDTGVFARGTTSAADDWVGFGAMVSRAGCALVLVTPLAPSSVPRDLRERAAVLSFDRDLTMGAVRDAVERQWGRVQ